MWQWLAISGWSMLFGVLSTGLVSYFAFLRDAVRRKELDERLAGVHTRIDRCFDLAGHYGRDEGTIKNELKHIKNGLEEVKKAVDRLANRGN